MKKIEITEYRDLIGNSVNIPKLIIEKSHYPTIVMDKDFTILFVNESALRLYNTSFEETFMKSYLGTYCQTEEEYDDFTKTYNGVKTSKEPLYINDKDINSYIMIFPILSPTTGEVEYFHNIFIIEEFHLTTKQKDSLRFDSDYLRFSHQLSLLIDAKDKYTANHSTNVTRYAGLLAKAIGMNGTELERLKLAASLHDIGKIHLPNTILNKGNHLTDDEYKQIQSHVEYSSKILSTFESFENISNAVLYHHERYDGTGYPSGLAGKEIPIEARIIAVADAFDAMTTDRPYRSALSFEKAVEELIANKWTQFDPFLIDKFLNLDLESEMNSLKEFSTEYTDEFTISKSNFELMSKEVSKIFENIDPFVLAYNMFEYNFYGAIIAKDLKQHTSKCGNRFDILYKNGAVEKLIEDKYLGNNWEMCLKPKRLLTCNHCPVDTCLSIKSGIVKKAKLINDNGDVKYLNTSLYPIYDENNDDTFIIEFFMDETLTISYGKDSVNEFFKFADLLSSIISEENREFRMIRSELRNLCNWIAEKIMISEHKIELLNKALSICDIGIIALLDSNEHSYESLKSLRSDNTHIEIIYEMISKLRIFSDIRDIVFYHHTNYNDTCKSLGGEGVPIQSYIISIADHLLTSVVTGTSVEDSLSYLESISGTIASPRVCDEILHSDVKHELIEILKRVALN